MGAAAYHPRLLVRTRQGVRAEWQLLGTTHNLWTLCRVWQRPSGPQGSP